MKHLFLIAYLMAAVPVWSAPIKDKYVSAELISEASVIEPGTPFWVALKLVHDEHWHTYWINDGDSGMPTALDWDLPDGFSAGPIVWPYPERIVMEPLVSYGFEGTTYLLIQIAPPENLPEEDITLSAHAKWLMCEEVCIPGRADVAVTLKTGPTATLDPARTREFAQARNQIPSDKSEWTFTVATDETHIRLDAFPPDGAPELESFDLFPVEKGVVATSLDTQWEKTENGYRMTLDREIGIDPLPDTFHAVIVSTPTMSREPDKQAIEIRLPLDAATAASPLESSPPRGLLIISLFAFLGGLVLNLMPCVFPVISLKILGFVNQAQQHPKSVWRHGLVFSFGVIISFWILAGILVALRAGGESIGWGFQLQSPPVLVGLSMLFFLLALNLFGVFELGLSLTATGNSVAANEGWAGSFFSGFLATIVATPCTAPFMGVALGYALTQPPHVSMIVFTALALGMAFPYLLLSRFPVLLKALPKPGPWMETMKQLMGFVLMATVVWLFWVLASLISTNGLTYVLGALLCMAMAAWILGKWDTLARSSAVRRSARLAALSFGIIALVLGFRNMEPLASSSSSAGEGWESFSPERLAELRAEGKSVFIDFTAKWCLTCQVNKLTVLRTASIMKEFREKNVTLLYADWTDENETIAAELARHGRQSVPLYVLYPEDTSAEPVLLPEILTQKIVTEALKSVN